MDSACMHVIWAWHCRGLAVGRRASTGRRISKSSGRRSYHCRQGAVGLRSFTLQWRALGERRLADVKGTRGRGPGVRGCQRKHLSRYMQRLGRAVGTEHVSNHGPGRCYSAHMGTRGLGTWHGDTGIGQIGGSTAAAWRQHGRHGRHGSSMRAATTTMVPT
jgi:hypothetical protein